MSNNRNFTLDELILANEFIQDISSLSISEKADIWSQINSCKIPLICKSYSISKYHKFSTLFESTNGVHFSLHIMDNIESDIGRKECLRGWNKGRMNAEEFEQFWYKLENKINETK
jgi:hypothetical protein